MTQNRMGVGRVTFSCKGSMKDQYVFLMEKISKCLCFLFISGDSASYFIEIIMCISWEGTLTQTK